MHPTVLPSRLVPKRKGQRDLLLLHVPQPADLTCVVVPGSRYFVSFLAWNSADVSAEELSRVARLLLDAGCVYFSCWGEGCERLHDIIDDEYAVDGLSVNDDESTIMTTWHEDETLEEAAWFVAHGAHPDDRFFQECRSVLALSVGPPEQQELVAQALLVAHSAA